MYSTSINLTKTDNMINFSKELKNIDCEMDLKAGVYEVDAKSIDGLFSLSSSNPITIKAYTNNKKEIQEINKIISKYNEQIAG